MAERVRRGFTGARRRLLEVRQGAPMRLAARARGRHYVAHFGLHEPANAGDTVLFEATRRAFDVVLGRQRWKLEPLRRKLRPGVVSRLNAEASMVVVGGGGLLIPDTNQNVRSGWQWNASIEEVRSIQAPLVFFALGYNRFMGQAEFAPVFADHISACVEVSTFFGLRNHGSISALTPYLREDLAARLCFQPCPTTVLGELYPDFDRPAPEAPRLALNCAFDRADLRYGPNRREALERIAVAVGAAKGRGWEIALALHDSGDDQVGMVLRDHGIDFTVAELRGRPARDVLDFYSRMSLSIGMRGHSQLIPFGLGRPIISLVSHDKLRWFLDDVGRPDLALELSSERLTDELDRLIRLVEAEPESVTSDLLAARQRFWQQTTRNIATLGDAVGTR